MFIAPSFRTVAAMLAFIPYTKVMWALPLSPLVSISVWGSLWSCQWCATSLFAGKLGSFMSLCLSNAYLSIKVYLHLLHRLHTWFNTIYLSVHSSSCSEEQKGVPCIKSLWESQREFNCTTVDVSYLLAIYFICSFVTVGNFSNA